MEEMIIKTQSGTEYRISVLADKLAKAGVRELREYENQKSLIFDMTMSCDHGEARGWLVTFMREALSMGNGSKDNNLRGKFLAAYDILVGLTH